MLYSIELELREAHELNILLDHNERIAMSRSPIASSRDRMLQAASQGMTTRLKLIDAKITDHIQDFAKREYRALFRQVHTKFPRELWDIIYHHILGEHQIGVNKLKRGTQNLQTSGILDPAITTLLYNQLHSCGYSYLIKVGVFSNEMMSEFAET